MRDLMNIRYALTLVMAVVGLVILAMLYNHFVSPTRVALVNYQGFQAAKIINAGDAGWVKTEQFNGTDYSQLDSYDFVMIFGRGLKLSEQALSEIKLQARERMIIVDAPMNPAHSINSVPDKHKELVSAYIDNAGEANYRNLLRYIRHTIQGRTFSSVAPDAPVNIAADVLFHLDPAAVFTEFSQYQRYYAKRTNYSSQGKKIALLTSVPGPFNSNRDHIDALIEGFERSGYRVYPLASASRRLELLQHIKPDLVVFMPHGRLHMGEASQAINWLQQQNIPVLSPLSVFERHSDWLDDPQGYSGALLSMNVVLPELDGAIAPFVLNALYEDEKGSEIFKAIPDRLERFISMVDGYLALKSAPNENKKIGIVYFRGPGKNALHAGNMEVAESLYNTLLALRSEGYNLAGLPTTFNDFKTQLDRQGTVMTPRAAGQTQHFLQEANPAFIPAEQYRRWCRQLAHGICDDVEAIYGPAPGNYLVDEARGLAVARLRFGNVAILPQPLPGYGDNTFKLVHGTDKAPPHTYLGAYFWLRRAFGADAVVHFGTHGSLEFTPSKQVALAANDWSDALIGGIPHFYIYTMSNVGEAIIAKRRSYAVIVNHLTPPFSRAGLTSDLGTLQRALSSFSSTEGAVREQHRLEINELLTGLHLDTDLGLEAAVLRESSGWVENVYRPASEWLETIAQEKITQGLYTLGSPYTKEESLQTARLMFQDSLTSHIVKLSELTAGNTARLDTSLAQGWISLAEAGSHPSKLLAQAVGTKLIQEVSDWQSAHPTVNDMDIIRGFVSLSEAKSPTSGKAITSLDDTQLQDILIRLLADPSAREFIIRLDNDTSYSHVARVLDPAARKRAEALAKVIPPIGEALTQLAKPEVETLVTAMQKEKVRKKVLAWVKSDDLAEQVEAARQQRWQALGKEARTTMETLNLALTADEFETLNWKQQKQHLEKITLFEERFLNQAGNIPPIKQSVESLSGLTLEAYREIFTASRSRYEAAYQQTSTRYRELAAQLETIEQLLGLIKPSSGYLRSSTQYELQSLMNGLAGGYVPPASGGDPVLNPAALPTGRNMYSIDAEKTPSASAWKVGVSMAEALLASHIESHGAYPQKVAFTLWPSSFIHSHGATIAEILYLLGVEPVRDPFGRIQSLRLIPEAKLGRPRIDVVVQSAGQLRDLAASRLALIEEAVALAATAGDKGENFVSNGVRAAEKYLLDKGQSPMAAKQLSLRRSFGGVNNSYGTGIMGLVENSNKWGQQQDIAEQYLQNMGALYGDSESWGQFNQSLLAAALLNTDAIVQPRSSNTWGALSLDHVYEFMGGLSAAVTQVTGTTPDAYFNDFRNSAQARVKGLEETIRLEARTTLLNPEYINGLADEGGASSAETFAETFRNVFGWNAMRPQAIDEALWEQLQEVYVNDTHNLELRQFFEEQNPYALQEMTGVMLEASRKGFWHPSEQALAELAELHAELVKKFEAGCGTFTCGNPALRAYIEQVLTGELLKQYSAALDKAEVGPDPTASIVLVEQDSPAARKEQREENATQRRQIQETTATETQDTARSTSSIALWIGLTIGAIILLLASARRKRGRG